MAAEKGGGQAAPSPLEIIRASTRLSPVPLVPEVRLLQASEPISLWEDTERVTGRSGLDPPFWAFAWAGGRALARYLLDHPEVARGRSVLDIASGSGLVAIAAAMAGAASVTACDIDPLAAAAIEANAAANKVSIEVVGADVLGGPPIPVPHGELVLAADAFYERDLAEKVTRFLARARAGGADVLAGDFGRTYLPRDVLVPVATYDVPGLQVLEGTEFKRTTVWTLREQPGPS
jgi:predicted nicotinamide N-methyase